MINIKIFVDYSFSGRWTKRRCVIARNSRSFKVVIKSPIVQEIEDTSSISSHCFVESM